MLSCAPVISVGRVNDIRFNGSGKAIPDSVPLMTVTTRMGTAIVPADLPRRESMDHQMPACMRIGGNGMMRLLCIFIPPGM